MAVAPRNGRSARIAAGCLLVCLVLVAGAADAPVIRNVTVPLLYENKAQGTLKAGKIAKGRQKRGFLRVGILPNVRAEGVTVRIKEPQAPERLLRAVAKALAKEDAAIPIEINRLEIIAPSFTLLADQVFIDPNQSWKFEGVIARRAGEEFKVPAARFNAETLSFTAHDTNSAAALNRLFAR